MSKQLLAKIGVFALIVVNLGAYYVFWPDGSARAPAEYGKTSVLAPVADKGESPANPVQFASSSGTNPPPAPDPTVSRFSADKDKLPAIPDPLTGDKTPGVEPPPKSDIVLVQGKLEDRTLDLLKKAQAGIDKGTPIPLALPPRDPKAPLAVPPPKDSGVSKAIPTENSPWTLQWERAGGQTTLLAKLHKRTEFRIVCDGIKMETPDGPVLAVGKVRFTAPGLKGSCDRLSLGLGGDHLVLDGKAELQVQSGGSLDLGAAVELKGEHLALRLQQPPAAPVTPVQSFPSPGTAMPKYTPPVDPPLSPFAPPPRPFPLDKK